MSDAKAVLWQFFDEMKKWEAAAVSRTNELRLKNRSEQERLAFTDQIFSELSAIVLRFTGELPNRKSGFSYGDPPEYDPDVEELLEVKLKGGACEIYTVNRGEYRRDEKSVFKLRLVDNHWLILSRHEFDDNGKKRKRSLTI